MEDKNILPIDFYCGECVLPTPWISHSLLRTYLLNNYLVKIGSIKGEQ